MKNKLKILFTCAILLIPSLSSASGWNLWEVSRYLNDGTEAKKEWQLMRSFSELKDCEDAKEILIDYMIESWKTISAANGNTLQITRKDDRIILKNDDKSIEEKFVCLPKEKEK